MASLAQRPRRFSRSLRMRSARKQVEQVLYDGVQRAFYKGWLHLVPHIRRLKKDAALYKQSSEEQMWAEWEQAFNAALDEAFLAAIGVLGEADREWYASAGLQVDYDPRAILEQHQVGRNIRRIGSDTRSAVDAKIRGWYATDLGMDALINDLSREFGENRARLIAITETTAISSTVTRELMRAGGLSRWTWETLRDELVCVAICAPNHGQVFTFNDPMPPDASHPGCRCQSAPVLPDGPSGEPVALMPPVEGD